MSIALENREEVVERIRRLTPELRALGVSRLALFGSVARGNQHDASDVDLLIQFEPGRKTYDSFSAVYDLLEGAIHRRIELVTVESLSPFIGPRILDEAVDVVSA